MIIAFFAVFMVVNNIQQPSTIQPNTISFNQRLTDWKENADLLPDEYRSEIFFESTHAGFSGLRIKHWRSGLNQTSISTRPEKTVKLDGSVSIAQVEYAAILNEYYAAQLERVANGNWGIKSVFLSGTLAHKSFSNEISDETRLHAFSWMQFFKEIIPSDVIETVIIENDAIVYNLDFSKSALSSNLDFLRIYFDRYSSVPVRIDEKMRARSMSSSVVYSEFQKFGDAIVPMKSETYFPGLLESKPELYVSKKITPEVVSIGGDVFKLENFGLISPTGETSGWALWLWLLLLSIAIVTSIFVWLRFAKRDKHE